MAASWAKDKDYNPDHLAKKLEKIRAIDKSGNVTFKGFQYTEWSTIKKCGKSN
ncbi:MAG: hypothetical protein ACW98F_17400 [Candidatus Hodarchaeales archaeon]|jgi:hypothetical protein